MSMQKAMEVLTTMPTPEQKAAAVPDPKTEIPPRSGVESTPPPVEVKPEDKKPTEDVSRQFAALAKREKAIVRQQQEFKAREAAYAAKEAEIAKREAKIAEADRLWNEDVFKSLEARGLDYNKLTKMFLDGQTKAPAATLDPAEAVKRQLEEFEKRQQDKENAAEAKRKEQEQLAEARQKEELEKAYANYKTEVAEFIKTNSGEYELTALYDQTDLVVETVQGYFDQQNKVLSIKEACELVEKFLEEEAQKAIKTKKLSKLVNSAPVTEKKETNSAPTKTLHNQLTPTMSSNLSAKSEQDRMKRALAKLG